MKKKLSVIQIILLAAAALLPLSDKMFEHHSYAILDMDFPQHSTNLSLQNMVQVQGFAPSILYTLFYVLVIATAIFLVASLFFPRLTEGRKAFAALPAGAALIGAVMIIIVHHHSERFMAGGVKVAVYATMGALGYL